MITTFNEKEYAKKVRNAFIKVLNSDTLKYSTFRDGEQKHKANQRAHKFVPGASMCENADTLCSIATINGYRDIEKNGKTKRVGVLKVGKSELLVDYESLTERLHPFTGIHGDNACKSVCTDSYIKSEILCNPKSLIQIFEDDDMVGKKCVLRYVIPAYNERGEKKNVVVLDALWTEDYQEEPESDDTEDYPIYHDHSLDEPLYVENEDEEDSDDEEEDDGLEDVELPEDFDDDEEYDDDGTDGYDYTIADEDSDGITCRHALMKSQIFILEYCLKYPMAAAAIPCDIFTGDGVYVGQEYGTRQAEIVEDVFKEYRSYFENRLQELKQRQHNNYYLTSPTTTILDF